MVADCNGNGRCVQVRRPLWLRWLWHCCWMGASLPLASSCCECSVELAVLVAGQGFCLCYPKYRGSACEERQANHQWSVPLWCLLLCLACLIFEFAVVICSSGLTAVLLCRIQFNPWGTPPPQVGWLALTAPSPAFPIASASTSTLAHCVRACAAQLRAPSLLATADGQRAYLFGGRVQGTTYNDDLYSVDLVLNPISFLLPPFLASAQSFCAFALPGLPPLLFVVPLLAVLPLHLCSCYCC